MTPGHYAVTTIISLLFVTTILSSLYRLLNTMLSTQYFHHYLSPVCWHLTTMLYHSLYSHPYADIWLLCCHHNAFTTLCNHYIDTWSLHCHHFTITAVQSRDHCTVTTILSLPSVTTVMPSVYWHLTIMRSSLCYHHYSVFLTVFHSIKSPDNSPFSHSVLPVLSLPYWSFQLYFSLGRSPSAVI